MQTGIGPTFEPVDDSGICEVRGCSRVATFHAIWPYVFKRVCKTHKGMVDGKRWSEVYAMFGTSNPPK